VLCIWQRFPFAAVAIIAVAALCMPLTQLWRTRLLFVISGIFASGGALAFYHVGVEEHWWASIAACGQQGLEELNFGDLGNTQGIGGLKPCDQVDWRFFGVSMAGYNAMLSTTLAVTFAAIARTLIRRETK
jgi:disulfide bond formation protein DsbB